MPNKLLKLILFVSLILFLPLISSAAFYLPTYNITIDVKTQADKNFQYHLQGLDVYNNWVNISDYSVQTHNLAGSLTIQMHFPGERLIQDNADGLFVKNVNCISNFVFDPNYPNDRDIFIPAENGMQIYPARDGESIVCTFDNRKLPIRPPILIVPGITGTEMSKGSELLWADVARMLYTPLDLFLDPLAFNKDLTPSDSEVYTSKVIDSVIGLNYTEGLIAELTSKGYIENQTLFTFPYDWRYGVSGTYPGGGNNSDMLKNKITQILQQTGADKVDIIAHSMGGLIVKRYVLANMSDHHINKAVFVGVPNTGAPKAIKGLLQGDNLGIFFGPLGLSDSEMKKISQNMPGVYDLLPSNIYYSRTGSFLQTIDYGKSSISYPLVPSDTIIKDLNYNEYKSFMIAKGLNYQALNQAEELNTQFFNDYDLRTVGIDLYRIAGCKTGTLSKFIVASGRNSTQHSYAGMDFDVGDGTVPIQSSTNLPVDESKKYFSLKTDHSKLMSADGVRQQIASIISGTPTTMNTSAITQDISKCQLNGKAIEVFSPIDLTITDQNGNKLGLAQDGSIQNDIANADFEILGEPASPTGGHKFIYLPTDEGQTYNIVMQGTGTGTYTIKVKDIQNTQETKVESFYNLPATPELTGVISLGTEQQLTTLAIKQNASSQATIILPSKPEAAIYFDINKKDLVFASSDPDVTVSDQDDIIALTDKAGNITEIKLNDKDRKNKMKVSIKSIKYNGVAVDFSKNEMNFAWDYDKKTNNLKKFNQYAKSKKDFSIDANYDAKSNTTKITGKDQSGKINKTIPGIVLLKVSTNKGDLDWSY